MRISLLIPCLAVVLMGCSPQRRGDIVNTTYLHQLAASADAIVAITATDPAAAKAKAAMLQEKMCAYVAGLEAAGLGPAAIQGHIDLVGDRLGAAFALLAE